MKERARFVIRVESERTNKVRDIWECRYFPSKLPKRFSQHEELERKIGENSPFQVDDVYIIAPDIAKNIKLRKQERELTLKIKVMLERTDDDFEKWHTDVTPLKDSTGVWCKVLLTALEIDSDIERFSTYSDPDQFLIALTRAHRNIALVRVRKEGMRYRALRTGTQLEVAKVKIGRRVFRSVAFESPDLNDARAIRAQLSTEGLGDPTNYIRLSTQSLLNMKHRGRHPHEQEK